MAIMWEQPVVKVIRTSCIGLDILGKIIIHEKCGEGIVVGYSDISGQPAVFFYDVPWWNDTVVFVDAHDLTLKKSQHNQ